MIRQPEAAVVVGKGQFGRRLVRMMMMMMMRPKEGNAKKVMRESERLAINDANEKERGKQKKVQQN